MKKIISIFAIALAAVFAISCDKDGENEGSGSIEGTWTFLDDYHSITMTLKGGEFEWLCSGFKDTGSYTYTGGVLTLNVSKHYTAQVDEWTDDGKRVFRDYVEETMEYWGPRHAGKAVIIGEAMIWTLTEDPFFGGWTDSMILLRDMTKITLDTKKVQGTWEFEREQDTEILGKSKSRLEIGDGTYTFRDVYSIYDTESPVVDGNYTRAIRVATKESGTWSYKEGTVTLKVKECFSSTSGDYATGYSYSPVNDETMEAETWTKLEGNYDRDAIMILDEKNSMLYFYGMDLSGVFTKKK